MKVLHNLQGLDDGAPTLAGLFRDSAGHPQGTTLKIFLVDGVHGGGVFEVPPFVLGGSGACSLRHLLI